MAFVEEQAQPTFGPFGVRNVKARRESAPGFRTVVDTTLPDTAVTSGQGLF